MLKDLCRYYKNIIIFEFYCSLCMTNGGETRKLKSWSLAVMAKAIDTIRNNILFLIVSIAFKGLKNLHNQNQKRMQSRNVSTSSIVQYFIWVFYGILITITLFRFTPWNAILENLFRKSARCRVRKQFFPTCI